MEVMGRLSTKGPLLPWRGELLSPLAGALRADNAPQSPAMAGSTGHCPQHWTAGTATAIHEGQPVLPESPSPASLGHFT